MIAMEEPNNTDAAAQQQDEEQLDIYEIIQVNTGKFFFDQFGEVYADLKNEIIPVNSKRFKSFIAFEVYKETGKIVGNDRINSAISLVEANAKERRELFNRISWDEGRILYNLCDDTNTIISINCLGWHIIDNEIPLIFRRMNHQKPQCTPQGPGDIEILRKYLPPLSDKTWYLLKVFLVAEFVPHIPKPLLCPHGPHGSGKTTICKRFKSLVDPSVMETASFPKDHDELIQMLSHHYFLVFDNVSYLREAQSDALCRAVTGEGFSKRKLYTDDEDKIFSFRTAIALNGINAVPQKPDLLDRSILIEVERIPSDQRRTEEELASFEKEKPIILAGIFDVLSRAIAIKNEVVIKEKPRMADFAVWGEAISKAMGYLEGKFVSEYFDNIKFQNEEAVSANVIGEVLLEFMSEKQSWEGTATELLDELNLKADDLKLSAVRPGWPKAPHALKRRLRELKTNLQEMGIEILSMRSAAKRTLVIRKVSSEASQMSEAAETATKPEISDDGVNAGLVGFVTSSVTAKTEESNIAEGKDNNDAIDAMCHYHRDRRAVGSVKDPYAPGNVPLCSECMSEGESHA